MPRLATRPGTMIAILTAALAACGGGGGTAPADSTAAAAASGTPTTAPAPATPTPPTTAGNAETVGTARALSASASLSLAGVAEVPPAAQTPGAAAAGGRTFYVDSLGGDDLNDGSARAAGSAGAGPWRTLARLMQSDLMAGDTITLACNSVWRETLRLPVSGTEGRPILITAPSGCANKPAIDGSVTIAPAAWTQHAGNIYKTTLDGVPLQLFATTGYFTAAHHPNRGYLSSDPNSLYAAVAGDGNVVTANGRSGSTILTTGSDLALPAGATLTAGTRVRIRTNSWILDEADITTVNGNKLTLSAATSFPLLAGWGYFLMGQLWMLDSPGEWHYDASTKQLYAWMPDSTPPQLPVSVGLLKTGLDLNGRAYINIDGIAVRRVGTGMQLRGSDHVAIRNCTVEDTVEMGADAASSTAATLESNTLARIGSGAISARDDDSAPASGMVVRNNLISNSGVIMDGERVVSLPKMTQAAIRLGEASQVAGNTIINAGYNAIRLMGDSVAEDNFIFGACSVLDDCAGIYLSTYRGSTIRGNTVVRTRGSVAGKPAAIRYTQGQGIYLDDASTENLIENNTVVDADNGIQIHVSSKATVRGNRLYGNRSSQLWIQDREDYQGAVFGNVIEDNQFAAVYPGTVGVVLQTTTGTTASFGTFNGNRFYDRGSAVAVVAITASEVRALNFSQWQKSQGIGSRSPVDVTGTHVSGKGYASYSTAGTNYIANAQLLLDGAGWTSWNDANPMGQLYREACPSGWCLRYVAGASQGLIASPYFSVRQGQWYRLTMDLSSSQDAQPVQVVVRRGGGGTNGYESLSDRSLYLTANRSWDRYSIVFQATQTIVAGDPVTRDNGARVDIQNIAPGLSVSVTNMELVPISPDPLAQLSGVLVNVGNTTNTVECPFSTSQPTVCGKFIDLANDRALAWPLRLPARSGVIVYAQEPSLLDSDGDGIPDTQDTCPGTAAGAAVNASGCSYAQRK